MAHDISEMEYMPLNMRCPADAGMDEGALDAAIKMVQAHPLTAPHDLRMHIHNGTITEREGGLLGVVKPRGGPSGMVVRHGHCVATWGDFRRVDMAFSMTKSYLATIAGVAYDQGLLGDVDAKVADQIDDPLLDGEHNASVTWRMLLEQTSEWDGRLWNRSSRVAFGRGDGEPTVPGQQWEYNDVRVNLLAYLLLKVWRRPLPEILRDYVMNPVGASSTWSWHGYENSLVSIDGSMMQSVSGGGHWGGGMLANVEDHARLALLYLNEGLWSGQRVISQEWVRLATTPSKLNGSYGFLWWLDDIDDPVASRRPFYAEGGGGNVAWADPANDLVVVSRWMQPEARSQFVSLVRESVRS